MSQQQQPQQIPPNTAAKVEYKVREVNGNVQFFAKTTFLKPDVQVNMTTGTPGSDFPHGVTEQRREKLDRAFQLASDLLTNPVIVMPPEMEQQQQQQQPRSDYAGQGPAPFSDCHPT